MLFASKIATVEPALSVAETAVRSGPSGLHGRLPESVPTLVKN